MSTFPTPDLRCKAINPAANPCASINGFKEQSAFFKLLRAKHGCCCRQDKAAADSSPDFPA